MNDTFRERIVLELDASGVRANSLSGLITQLEQVEAHVRKVNAAIQGLANPPALARSTQQLEAQLKAMQTKLATQGGLTGGNLAKSLELDAVAFKNFLARNEQALKGFRARQQEFLNPRSAATAVAAFEREQVKRFESMAQTQRAALADLLKPSVVQVSPQLAPGAGKVDGVVALSIPAAQVQASVAGMIQLTIPGAQVQGVAAGGRDPATGQFAGGAGGGAGGGKKKKGGKGPLDLPPTPGELQRVRTETDKYLRETITAVDKTGDLVTSVHDSVEGIIRKSRKKVTGATPLAQFQEARRLAEENFKQLKAAIDPNDPGFGLAALQRKQADQLRALQSAPFMAQLSKVQRERVSGLLEAQAKTLEAKSFEAFREAQQKGNALYWRGRFAQESATQPRMTRDQRRAYEANFRQLLAEQDVARYGMYSSPIGPQRGRIRVSPQPPQLAQGVMQYPGPIGPQWNVKPAAKPPAAQNPFARGLHSFTPTGFASNLLNVSGWAAAVTVLYKSIELANYSLGRFITLGQQTVRLGQVFRGVGGTAQELAGDILKLAAAQNRDAEEAMDSAAEWSRLGLTRKQVNEATRVSAVAANVANMGMKDTTKQLAALMHVYNLEVGDLNGVLGMLVATSQRYNSQGMLEDLFQGLDKSAGAAKLAKVNLAELTGIIATVVARTGQSGVTVGNTFKSLLVQFANPDVQKYLRAFGIETLTNTGKQKSGSQILQEMAVRWQGLDPRQQQNLTWRLVGRQQAARFVPMMEGYIQSQRLAIDSQLRLNQAQEANVQILGTMKSALAGLRAEWDRGIMLNMNQKFGADFTPGGFLTNLVRGGKNSLKLFNESQEMTGGFRGRAFGLLPPVLAMRAVNWGLGKFNELMESPFERGQEELSQNSQRYRASANAFEQRARLFESLSQMLGLARNPRSDTMVANIDAAAGEMSPDRADVFKRHAASGDIRRAQALLAEEAKKARGESIAQVEKEMKERQALYATGQERLGQLQAEASSLQRSGAEQDKVNAKLREAAQLEQELHKLKAGQWEDLQALQAQAGEVEQVIELQQKYLNLLREQEVVMGAIDQLGLQQGMGTAGERLDAQVAAMDAQIELLNRTKETLQSRGGAEDVEAGRRLIEMIKEREAQRAALDSPQLRDLTRRLDARAIASRRAQEEAHGYGVGLTEADRLLNAERRLQQELNTLRARRQSGSLTENEAVRAKELEIQLWSTQEKIQMRVVELARQEKQIRLDAQREFSKNLLLAGPGEQLQRLYVMRLAQRPMGSGEFNALSPELKRLFMELTGGEAGMINRQEQSRLRGRGLTVEQEQAAQEAARRRAFGWTNELNRFTRGGIQSIPSLPLPGEAQARRMADQFGMAGSAAQRLGAALDKLTERVDRVLGGNAPARATPVPRLGVSPGFSMGANAPAIYRPRDSAGNVTGEYLNPNG